LNKEKTNPVLSFPGGEKKIVNYPDGNFDGMGGLWDGKLIPKLFSSFQYPIMMMMWALFSFHSFSKSFNFVEPRRKKSSSSA